MLSQSTIPESDTVIELSGDIDMLCGQQLSKLEKRLSKRDCVVIDVSQVEHVDTTFLRFLRRLKDQPNKKQRSAIKIVGLSKHLRRIFEITGFSSVFELEWKN